MPEKTKGEHINDAYSKLRISGLTVNPTAEDNELALTRIEDMLAQFEGNNMCMGYNFEQEPNPASKSGVDRKYNECISWNLALRLAPDFGKGASPDPILMQQAMGSYSVAAAMSATVNPTIRSRNFPLGSGNRWSRYSTFIQPEPPAPISCDTVVLPKGITRSYSESFIDFLDTGAGEEITSFTISASNGLTVNSSAIDADLTGIDYTVIPTSSGWQRIIIDIVTSVSTPNKAEQRVINFNVTDESTTDY